jgi:iron complex outermembrane receptor protein
VDRLPAQSTPAYMSLDLRLAWQPARNMELSIVGQNLLDPWHLEFGNVGGRPDPLIGIRRGVFGYFEWRR